MTQTPFEKRMQKMALVRQLPIDLQPINPAPAEQSAPAKEGRQEKLSARRGEAE